MSWVGTVNPLLILGSGFQVCRLRFHHGLILSKQQLSRSWLLMMQTGTTSELVCMYPGIHSFIIFMQNVFRWFCTPSWILNLLSHGVVLWFHVCEASMARNMLVLLVCSPGYSDSCLYQGLNLVSHSVLFCCSMLMKLPWQGRSTCGKE